MHGTGHSGVKVAARTPDGSQAWVSGRGSAMTITPANGKRGYDLACTLPGRSRKA